MLPTLVQFGSFRVPSLTVLAFLGIFLAAFFFWRRLRDLGLAEEKSLELFLQSLFLGLIIGRFGYIVTHFLFFSLNLYRWFHFVRYPGFSLWGLGLGFLVGLWFFSRKERFSYWRLADEAVFSLLCLNLFLSLGASLAGRELGAQTSFIWGIFYPGDMIRRHPVNLVRAFFYLLFWMYCFWAEKRWRFWKWYKSQKEGFLILSVVMMASGLEILLAFLKPVGVYSWIVTQVIIGGVGLTAGVIFYRRSGRKRLLAGTGKSDHQAEN